MRLAQEPQAILPLLLHCLLLPFLQNAPLDIPNCALNPHLLRGVQFVASGEDRQTVRNSDWLLDHSRGGLQNGTPLPFTSSSSATTIPVNTWMSLFFNTILSTFDSTAPIASLMTDAMVNATADAWS